jgi:hypothetical protein
MSIHSLTLRLRSVAEIWPMMFVSLGIVLSFAWATVLIWFLVCAIGSFT